MVARTFVESAGGFVEKSGIARILVEMVLLLDKSTYCNIYYFYRQLLRSLFGVIGILLPFILFLHLVVPSSAQYFSFRHLTTQEGLSHSTVYAVTQDARGFLWFGTREGLNRFDSYGIKTYPTSTTGGLEAITALVSFGPHLIVGTQTGLRMYEMANDQFVPLATDALPKTITSLHPLDSSRFFACTPLGLFIVGVDGSSRQIFSGNQVMAVQPYKKGVYWMALSNQIHLINVDGAVIHTYQPQYLLHANRQWKSPLSLFTDTSHTWVAAGQHLLQYQAESDAFVEVPIAGLQQTGQPNIIRAIKQDPKGRLWLGTENGLYIYDLATTEVLHFREASDSRSGNLSDRAIYSIYFSQEEVAWLGTYFGGVNYTTADWGNFNQFLPSQGSASLRGKAVSQLLEDDRGRLWIGTEDAGISVYDPGLGSFSYIHSELPEGRRLSSNNVHALLPAGDYLWIGTFLGGLNRLHLPSGRVDVFQNRAADSTSLSNDYVYALLKDRTGQLWVGSQHGLNRYHPETNSFERIAESIFANKFIYDLLEDHRGHIWIATRNHSIYRYIPDQDHFQHYGSQHPGISSNKIIFARQLPNQDIWFGTLEGGALCYHYEQDSFSSLRVADGLPNDNVYGIIEDGSDHLWLSTNQGLVRYHPTSGNLHTFRTDHGLSSDQFNFKSAYRGRDGSIYFGSVNGLNYFQADSLQLPARGAGLYFTSLKLFNQEVPIDSVGPLRMQFDQQPAITLEYGQNVLTIEYVAVDHRTNGNNTYAYYLEDFEKDWNEVGNKRSATYTNLSPGSYSFHLRASNPLDNSQAQYRQLQITILPPWYQTTWAYTGYCMLLLLSGFGLQRLVRFVHQQRMAVQREQIEKENLKTLNRQRLEFFTFISHEFKTPLTLIIAAVENFLRYAKVTDRQQAELQTINRSANRLHGLVQQLLEFRKLDRDSSNLNFQEGDVLLFLRSLFKAFQPLFESHHTQAHFACEHSHFFALFDPDKLEMMLTNIVSNAFKHSGDGGQLHLSVTISKMSSDPQQRHLCLVLRDTPKRIAGNEPLASVSEYQDGIGMALVKRLVDHQKGRFEVEQLDSAWLVRIELPLPQKSIQRSAKTTVPLSESILPFTTDLVEEKASGGLSNEKGKRRTLLILERSRDILRYLKKHFARDYQVIGFRNGQAALEYLQTAKVDLILCDLDLEGIDGISFCRQVRAMEAKLPAPIILMTAQQNPQRTIQALQSGALYCMAKPFSMEELELVLANTLRTYAHSNWQAIEAQLPINTPLPATNQELGFIQKVTTLTQEHLHEPDFNVGVLADKLEISRSLLHLRMKERVGMTTSRFIAQIRMQRAVALLESGLPVSEVAAQLGFTDPSYFSKVFKKHYQRSPSTYVAAD